MLACTCHNKINNYITILTKTFHHDHILYAPYLLSSITIAFLDYSVVLFYKSQTYRDGHCYDFCTDFTNKRFREAFQNPMDYFVLVFFLELVCVGWLGYSITHFFSPLKHGEFKCKVAGCLSKSTKYCLLPWLFCCKHKVCMEDGSGFSKTPMFLIR